MNGKIRQVLNGSAKPISIGTVTGLIVAGVAFVSLHMTLTAKYRGEGAASASTLERLEAVEKWQEDYDTQVRPYRDEFLKFMGELPGMRRDMDRMTMAMLRLENLLNDFEKRLSRMEGRTGYSGGGSGIEPRRIGDQR